MRRLLVMAMLLGTVPASPVPAAKVVVDPANRETRIGDKGVNPIAEYEAVGHELVLIRANDGRWYRMELQPFCIGDSRLSKLSRDGAQVEVDPDVIERLPRRLRDALFYDPKADPTFDERGRLTIPNPQATVQSGFDRTLPKGMSVDEGLFFTTHSDGSFDRRAEVMATTIDGQGTVHIESCRIKSLTAGDPPQGAKNAAK